MLDPVILSPGMVAVVSGPETLPNWTLESTKPQVPSSVDSRKFTLLLGWRMAQLGEGMADTSPTQVTSLSGLFHECIPPPSVGTCGLKPTKN